MEFIDSKVADENLRCQAWELIEKSFPPEERRPLKQHIEALADPAFHAEIVTDNNQFIGVVCYWLYDNVYFFGEHLATNPELRGSGYGARIMRNLIDKGHIMLLEIEPPVDEITIRRRNFYERLGFVVNDYLHIHPSYRPSTSEHELVVMSYPRTITQQEFDRFRDYSLNHILTYVEK